MSLEGWLKLFETAGETVQQVGNTVPPQLDDACAKPSERLPALLQRLALFEK